MTPVTEAGLHVLSAGIGYLIGLNDDYWFCRRKWRKRHQQCNRSPKP